MTSQVSRKFFAFIIPISGLVLIGLLWYREFVPLSIRFIVETGVVITTIILEVFVIGLLLDSFQERRRQQRLAGKRKNILRYLFHLVFNLSKGVKHTKSIQEALLDVDQSIEQMRAPVTQGELDSSHASQVKEAYMKMSQEDKVEFVTVRATGQIFHLCWFVDSVMGRLSLLVGQVSDMFSPDFVSTLLELAREGYAFSDEYLGIERGSLVWDRVGEVAEKLKSEGMKEVFAPMSRDLAKLIHLFGLYNFTDKRDALHKQCLDVLNRWILPRAPHSLQAEMRLVLEEETIPSSEE